MGGVEGTDAQVVNSCLVSPCPSMQGSRGRDMWGPWERGWLCPVVQGGFTEGVTFPKERVVTRCEERTRRGFPDKGSVAHRGQGNQRRHKGWGRHEDY